MSTPIVCKPALAKDNAVGRPILPIPITQTRSDCELRDSDTSSIFCIFIFKLDIIIKNTVPFELN